MTDETRDLSIDRRIESAYTLYGHQSTEYFVGALEAAYREVEAIEHALGVNRIRLRYRLDQMAAMIGKDKAAEGV